MKTQVNTNPSSIQLDADVIKIKDAAGKITATDVEGALAENRGVTNDHINSLTAHQDKKIVNTSNMVGANQFEVNNNIKALIEAFTVAGTDTDPRLTQALLDTEGKTWTNFADMLIYWESMVVDLMDKLSKEQSKPVVVTNFITVDDAYGGVVDFTVYGETVNNLVKNPTFVGTDDWIQWGGTVLTSVNNILTITGNGGAADTRVFQDFGVKGKAGDKYYFKLRARVTNPNCLGIDITLRDRSDYSVIGTLASVLNPVENKWYEDELDGIITLSSDTIGNLGIMPRATYADATTQNGKSLEIDGITGVKVIKLTGDDLTLTADQLAIKYSKPLAYGLNHVENPIVRQNGENCLSYEVLKLIIQTVVRGSASISNMGVISVTATSNDCFTDYMRTSGQVVVDKRSMLFRLKANTSYKYSRNITISSGFTNEYIAFYDSNYNVISFQNIQQSSGGRKVNTITTPIGTAYASIRLGASLVGTVTYSNLMISENLTDYIPHNKSEILTSNLELRSVPTIADKFSSINGEKIVQKNVSDDFIIDSSIGIAMYTGQTNLDWANFTLPDIIKLSYLTNRVISDRYGVLDITLTDSLSNIGKIATFDGLFGKIAVGFPKGTNVTDAKNALIGTVFNYQLATPLTIEEKDFPTYGITIAGDGIITALVDQSNTFIVKSDTFNPTVEVSYDLNIFTAVDSLKDVLQETRKLVTYLLTIQDEQDAILLDYGNRLSILEGV